MAFDDTTRKRLAQFVGTCRDLLVEEFTRQLQLEYGLDPATGDVTDPAKLRSQDAEHRETGRLLRETLEHYLSSGDKKDSSSRKAALLRIVREQAFTVLNRLCALRMAESRGLLVESVSKGYQSNGFQMFARMARTGLGETGDAYRCYLYSVFDELALDLPVLFDRFSAQCRLFPRETVLLQLLDQINHAEIESLWSEDETIGWIYQYSYPKELKDAIKKESKVPRNSYEIAVRSTYYTPRFVVESLVDNTLGRIWLEMTQGETRLKAVCRFLYLRPAEVFLPRGQSAPAEGCKSETGTLSSEEMLRQPVYCPYRPLKDPRTIRMLDPACGSMHFGLYAFDLYEVIYSEAWDLEEQRGVAALDRPAQMRPLHETYATKADFLVDVPRLIIEHNVHGIDIDPRCVQIAGLSLWLRAQKSWHKQGIKSTARPRITKSHIVCAEPMPGNIDLLREFTATLSNKAIGQLVEMVFDKMVIAGEAGFLLRSEKSIRDIVAKAKKQWRTGPRAEQGLLFAEPAKPSQSELQIDTSGITDEQFWERAEDHIYKALAQYAESAQNGHRFARRLFAEDAARGFAFIDLCRSSYDVVLMNPPYAETEGRLQAYLKTEYPGSWTNLYSAFMERALSVCQMRIGLVCPDGFLSAYRMKDLRSDFITRRRLESLSCLGTDVFDEMGLSTIAMALTAHSSTLHPVLIELGENGPGQVDYINSAVVNERTNFALTPDLIRSSSTGWRQEALSPTYGVVTKGNCTFDDDRFVRTWWEVPAAQIGSRWQRWQKGGEYQPFFSSTPYVIDWEKSDDGAAMRCFGKNKVGTDAQVAQSSRYWWRCGLVGPAMNTTGAGFNIRVLPSEQIFSAKSTVIIPEDRKDTLVLCGLLNSRLLRWFLYQQGAGLAGNTGKIKKLPIIWPTGKLERDLASLTREAIETMAALESFRDTSPCFIDCVRSHEQFVEQYRNVADRLDSTVSQLYGEEPHEEAVKATEELVDAAVSEATGGLADPAARSRSLLVFCLGVLFGRWDIRIALDSSELAGSRDPFAPLPACPPGMLQDERGLPAFPTDVPAEYPLRISWPGVLVDDDGHPDDIATRIRETIGAICGERAEAIEQEACDILSLRELREFFRRPAAFFSDHLKRYTRSRRVAPIYWPLSTASGSYTLWLYYQRLTDQTLYTCVNNFVDPKLKQVEEDSSRLRTKSDRSSSDEKELERLSDLAQDLKEFREELLRIAGFWRPNLNDGVQITAAPLWRLFQHKPWQKKLKDTWSKLESGDYDWAHLALSIWPERVTKKSCREDRSIAIAHDLEDELWEEVEVEKRTRGGKVKKAKEWRPKELSEDELDSIVEKVKARKQ